MDPPEANLDLSAHEKKERKWKFSNEEQLFVGTAH